jgi:tRNA nucleotidyltransferase (CCA-adding enzyme)
MPDYIYLLENRLSNDQRNALFQLREAARGAETILFLTGDAVRDLTSGHAVRDLEVAVHGNALKLKKTIEKLGGKVWGEDEPSRSLYLCFPGTVRVDLISTHRVEYPKPGKPVFHPASIHEDLHRRDFTVNSMAISLNEGSFGLLMDPLNGAADTESRTLRLVSNYGFLEEPALLIRATRYRTRLGWELDPRSQTRYENAKNEGVIEFLSAHARSQELEQIGHEEEGLKVLRALEAEGWMKSLFPAWTAEKADEQKLNALHELAVELLVQGVHADVSAAQMQLLTAGLSPKDLASLKKSLLRPGFVEEWNSLDALAAGFSKVLLAKQNTAPSAGYKLFTSYDPEAVLWLGFTSKSPTVQERFRDFLKGWPEARQRIPYALMQEMRITPELPSYKDIAQSIFLELIDGKLTTPEEVRAFLEPHSPPAPPPQVTVKRTRGRRGEAKLKEHAFEEEEEEESLAPDEESDDEEEFHLGEGIPKVEIDLGGDEEEEPAEELEGAAEAEEAEEDEEEAEPVRAAPASRASEPPHKPHLAADGKNEKSKARIAVKEVQTHVHPKLESKPKPAQAIVESAPEKTKPVSAKTTPASPAGKKAAAQVKPAIDGKAPKASAKGPGEMKSHVKPAAKSAAKAATGNLKGKPVHATQANPSKGSHHAKPPKAAAKKSAAKPAKKR